MQCRVVCWTAAAAAAAGTSVIRDDAGRRISSRLLQTWGRVLHRCRLSWRSLGDVTVGRADGVGRNDDAPD